ncbi:MAG: hypothetical protein IT371_20565 [Deltaproteobacteria bacterium]|nr:hypothetical protein [Deltaproteobacteria bacterium]
MRTHLPSWLTSVSLALILAHAPGVARAQVRPGDEPRAPVPAPNLADRKVVGYDRGFFLRDGDERFLLRVNARVQARGEVLKSDLSAGGRPSLAFSIHRARLKLSGHFFTPRLTFEFQPDFGRGFVTLRDFFAEWAFAPWLRLRVGQFKRPFSRQQVTSSGDLQLVDRALTDKAFLCERDIGFMLHNSYHKEARRFEWAVGVFNGAGDAPLFSATVETDPKTSKSSVKDGKFSTVPTKLYPALVARAGYHTAGSNTYSESDLEGGGLRLGVAASLLAEFDYDENQKSRVAGELDGMLKVHGFSLTGGAYVASAQRGPSFSDQGFGAVGVHAQTGLLLAKRFEPVLRYGAVVWSGSGNDQQEFTVGFNLFVFKHGFKWQTDASVLSELGGGRKDGRIRTQLQAAF